MKEQLSPLVDLINQQKLLRMEYDYEKENFFQLTKKSDISVKRRKGYCWYPVTPEKSYYNAMNQRVVEVSRSPDDETDHQFEYGQSVLFFFVDGNGKINYFKFTAKISYVRENVM
ncbi:MAG: helicase, partial [Tannerella sp.]|nr:helicase [Tannerella sp.]